MQDPPQQQTAAAGQVVGESGGGVRKKDTKEIQEAERKKVAKEKAAKKALAKSKNKTETDFGMPRPLKDGEQRMDDGTIVPIGKGRGKPVEAVQQPPVPPPPGGPKIEASDAPAPFSKQPLPPIKTKDVGTPYVERPVSYTTE